MSFMYPRTIAISRQVAPASGGVQPYGGMAPTVEKVIYSGIQASIQQKSTSSRSDANLPADATSRTMWRVFVPLSAGIAPGSVLRGDIVTDEFGQRHQVVAPYINSLGPNFLVERLES